MKQTLIKLSLRLGILLVALPVVYSAAGGRPSAALGAVAFSGIALMLLASGFRHLSQGYFRHATAKASRAQSPIAFWLLVLAVDFGIGLGAIVVAVVFALRVP